MSARRVGRGTRLATSLQVGLAVCLALAGALFAIDLADARFVRVDLSASGRNTLPAEVAEVVEALPEPVRIDVFFRPLEKPYAAVALEAQARMRELLFSARNARRDRIELVDHADDRPAEARERMEQLGVEGTNLIVFSCGERRTSVPLFGGVVTVDWGNPQPAGLRYLASQGIAGIVDPREYDPDPGAYRPARLRSFRGMEAFAEALLKVASARRPRVLFSVGHGEPDPAGTLGTDFGRFRGALERDGFEVGEWDGAATGAVPAETDVLLVLGARQPLGERELEAVRAYVAEGGRVIAAPGFEEVADGLEGGTTALLFGYGMIAQPGVVCEALTDALGRSLEGFPECARIVLSSEELTPSHPLTATFRRRGLRLELVRTHSFRRGGLAGGGLLLDLIHSSRDSWRDLPDAEGRYDFRFDPALEERGRQRLVMLAELPERFVEGETRVERGRVLGVASADFFADRSFDTNRDFLLAAANWMAEREELVRVSPRELADSVLDLQRGPARPVVFGVAVVGLPALVAAVGLLFAWRRRR